MDSYPAAERLARDLVLPTDTDLDKSMGLWRGVYLETLEREPSDIEVRAAERVLEQRIAGVCPPLPSASMSGAIPRMRIVDWLVDD